MLLGTRYAGVLEEPVALAGCRRTQQKVSEGRTESKTTF